MDWIVYGTAYAVVVALISCMYPYKAEDPKDPE